MTNSDHIDLLIIGAGLSGIGMACQLQRHCPGKSYAILEGRAAMGGTWDLFRYPGIRADSDMYTLSYLFRPWTGAKEIADGDSILQYIKDTAAEYEVESHIRYGHSVRKATWSTQDATWTVDAVQSATGESVRLSCDMLLMCAGYYSYESGYTPEFKDRERFRGQILHPQQWPSDFDCTHKKVIVIGSGATAVTLVPVLADDAEHVVMLQRSPTYMMSRPEVSLLSRILRKTVPQKVAYAVSRWWNITTSSYFYRRSRTNPEKVRQFLLHGIRKELGSDYNIEKHFSPNYGPWDQRLCLVRNGDLFASIREGKASVVTDRIVRFTEDGILLESGQELHADVIVTATGLSMEVWGGVQLVVDGQRINPAETFTYKGMMISDVPNLVTTFGYINASWTLRADLISEFTCRLINHMDRLKMRQCTPRLSAADRDMTPRPFIVNFSSNYIQRAMHLMPKQGDREPWLNTQDYERDVKMILRQPLDDGSLHFENPIKDPETDSDSLPDPGPDA